MKPRGAFARYAVTLLDNGYSPVPLRPGTKRPLQDKWDHLRQAPMSLGDIASLAVRMPYIGLGVAGGYGGLVPIDIDTEDQAIWRIIAAALPKPTVIKIGRKGWTAFYRAAGAVPKASKFRPRLPDGRVGPPIVEILTTGQTVLPPTMHPDTGQPYRWDTRPTLFTRTVGELVPITAEHLDALAEALRPLCKTAIIPPHQQSGQAPPQKIPASRMRAYALGSVQGYARRLAMHLKGGRHDYVLRAANALGAYYHHGILGWGEIETPLLAAAANCKLVAEDGRNVRQTIGDGIRNAATYQLPPLPARQYWGRSDGR